MLLNLSRKQSRTTSLVGLQTEVLLIHGKFVVVIFVHFDIGPVLFYGCSCAATQSRPQLTTSALKKGLQKVDD
jgi:hypothetical protein